MEIKINLDESRFKGLVDEELGKFTDEEIHGILAKALEQYVVDEGLIGQLFFMKKTDYWGKETGGFEPTPRLERLVGELNVSDILEDIKAKAADVLKEDDTVRGLMESVFYRMLSDRVSELMWNNGALESLIMTRVNQALDDRLKR